MPLPQNPPQKTTKFKFGEANHIDHYTHSRLFLQDGIKSVYCI